MRYKGTRIESGVPQGSVIGPILFLFFCHRPTKCHQCNNADDGKMVSPRSQSDLLQSSLYNVWKWSVNKDLPINLTTCNYITIGLDPPLQLSLATEIRAIPYRLQTLLKTWAFSWTISSHPPSIAERLPPM